MNVMTRQNTDIAANTSAERARAEYLKCEREIARLEYLRDVLAKEYLAQMKRADIPAFLSCDFIFALFDENKEKRESSRSLFLDAVFAGDIREKVKFRRFVHGGWDDKYLELELLINDCAYKITLPMPRNNHEKDVVGGALTMKLFWFRYSAHVSTIGESEGVATSWSEVAGPTYDYMECFKAVEEHARQQVMKRA